MKAREQAENANQIKGQFLLQMSHEISTLMNGVIGSLDLIDQQTSNPEQMQHSERAKDWGQHLLTVINKTLQFSGLD